MQILTPSALRSVTNSVCTVPLLLWTLAVSFFLWNSAYEDVVTVQILEDT